MKSTSQALRAAVLAALIPFAAFAADPAKPGVNPAPAPETPLHEIGGTAEVTPTPTARPTARRDHGYDDDDRNRVSINGDVNVGPHETVEGNAVSVFGDVKVDGTLEGNSVCVFGSTTINGTVRGNVVDVLGMTTLGANSHVEGNVVSVSPGRVIKEPGAIVEGNIVRLSHGVDLSEDSGAASWMKHGLRLGRPLAFGPHLLFFWVFAACQIALYLLLALIFPGGIRKCGDTLAQRLGITFLTGMLSILGLPVLFILLCVTVVGIPVALIVLPLSIVASVTFGKAAVYGFVGRSIIGKEPHPVFAVVVGVAVLMACYLIPFLGLAIWFLVAFLGFACAITTLFSSARPPPPAAAPAVPPPAASPGGAPPAAPALVEPVAVAALATPGAPAVSAPLAEVAPPPLQQAAAAAAVPPLVSAPVALAAETALPRAGFWIRMVALLIDVILVGILTQMTTTHLFFLVLALYGAILWKVRGATIGGIIFGLKVVRMDGKPMEWTTVIVRALACFFSMIIVGLGFIWIAFDPEKQGWHDKIAGTVVVRLPKGQSLV